jgi:hypothetical protein
MDFLFFVVTNGVTILLTVITFDTDLGFQPSKGHFDLKFYAPSYHRIKNEKKMESKIFKDGDQNFFLKSQIDEIWRKFFSRWRPKFFFKDGVQNFFFLLFDFQFIFELKIYLYRLFLGFLHFLSYTDSTVISSFFMLTSSFSLARYTVIF